jgi:hypothetical protein
MFNYKWAKQMDSYSSFLLLFILENSNLVISHVFYDSRALFL